MNRQIVALKRRLLWLCLIFAISAPSLFAAQGGIDFTIRYYNQTIAYPDSKIPIKIEITNNSGQPFRFSLSSDHAFNLSFDVLTLTNVAVPQSNQFIMSRNTNQPVFFREVSLDPGQQFSFVENLSDFVNLGAPTAGAGVYVVQATFYPTLYSAGATDAMKSNMLTLNVHPGSASIPSVQAAIDASTGEVLKQEALPPDEVVAYTITARQKSQWNKFFLYIDVKNLMLQQPDLQRRYVRSSDQQQRDMVTAFKQQLQQQKTDSDILVVPSSFTILKTSYTPTEATVQVLENFTYPSYTEKKEYTYYLHRPQNVWLIYNYTVRNLGTQ
ncbi:MAG TPA: hypothetical protein VMV68_10690 [Spirochaetia bacterium]|nr:hypothetical protein [Spirochaetia bacterium]